METGRNQIYLSASKAQAHVSKNYIKQFARESADIELQGEVIAVAERGGAVFPRHQYPHSAELSRQSVCRRDILDTEVHRVPQGHVRHGDAQALAADLYVDSVHVGA